MELFLVVLALGVSVAMILYAKKQYTPTVSIKPATPKEVQPQITDAVTVTPVVEVKTVVEEAPKKRGRKPKVATTTKKPKKIAAPKTTKGKKKKS